MIDIGGPDILKRCNACHAVMINGECARNGPNCNGIIRKGSNPVVKGKWDCLSWFLILIIVVCLMLVFGMHLGIIET